MVDFTYQTTLYLGRSRPDGSPVTDSEFDTFLAVAVSPAFGSGFTLESVKGAWRDAATGRLIREDTTALVVLHSGGDSVRELEQAGKIYKLTHEQDAVIMVTQPVTGRLI